MNEFLDNFKLKNDGPLPELIERKKNYVRVPTYAIIIPELSSEYLHKLKIASRLKLGDEHYTNKKVFCLNHWYGRFKEPNNNIYEQSIRVFKYVDSQKRGRKQKWRENLGILKDPLIVTNPAIIIIQRAYRRYRINRAARLIQCRFKECISNPGYKMCRSRLMRELLLLSIS